ncbi:hypothetical protein HMPREF0591_6389 [Mycobacterium parascrofulaceum ATCC BAA-614]|uniref:Uncharacterized protein n=1 Tax=Mycobacterium parascrofulaceum ATCC BAA-614 TaxID=525368 RepID=D5PJP5_9MYCO|nr:hypothetical protein [Mycobacterium parascrofulaceum]EFG73702.1 hypothetical protein HMPREF0591_6389 [Mycobacterium parascrofulaceum ATCC BAA-614]
MTPWWQPVLGTVGVVLAAIIAGSFAVRNARKTPHETLKTLVEIAEKAGNLIEAEDLDVLKAAVHREIQRIDRLNQARVEGFWKYWWENVKQSLAIESVSFDLGGVAKVTWRRPRQPAKRENIGNDETK